MAPPMMLPIAPWVTWSDIITDAFVPLWGRSRLYLTLFPRAGREVCSLRKARRVFQICKKRAKAFLVRDGGGVSLKTETVFFSVFS